MKATKKLLSMLVALIMVVTMAVPAFAADTYTIKITNSDAISSAGHKYHAYQIFAGVLDSSGKVLTDITWGENVADGPAFIAALKANDEFKVGGTNIFATATTAADVASALAKTENQTATVIEAFARTATEKKAGLPVASSTESDAPYTIVIPAAKTGYYLVVDDESVLAGMENKDVSDFILQVVGDVTVEHKGSIPTMDKTVSKTGETYGDYIATGIGDVHYYRIIAELPDDYYLYDTYYLEFSDTLSKGLTFLEVKAVKAIIRSSGTTVDITGYDLNKEIKADGSTEFSLAIDNLKSKAALSADDAVEIIYTATVNTDAVVNGTGIPNNATIIYSNNPNSNGKGESKPDETNVYPINLVLLKNDGKDESKFLPGAQFVLNRDHSDGINTHKEYAMVEAGKLTGWAHHFDGDGCAVGNAEHDAAVLASEMGTILTTDVNGQISVSGLDAGKFYLQEIKAPDGYNKLTEPVTVSVHITVDDNTDTITGISGSTNASKVNYTPATATVELTVNNFKGDVLPSTGGMGTTLFYLAGGTMVALAVVMLVTKKRMED